MADLKRSGVPPRIIIHGGAGNITRDNMPKESYNAYRKTLLEILHDAHTRLCSPGATALDTAAHAVVQLENNALFNSGHGAVYTTEGTQELEASVMVSKGYRKRGVGVMKVTKTKNPILLAKTMLEKGEKDDGGGAHGHCQLHGAMCDKLAEEWGLEMVRPSYFWTMKRWEEHRRGLGLSHTRKEYEQAKRAVDEGAMYVEGDQRNEEKVTSGQQMIDETSYDTPSWDSKEYLPQGTVGCVVLDSTGTLCVATSTGGITNKLPGRIGDTPSLGAGFWAEEWNSTRTVFSPVQPPQQSEPDSLAALFSDCLPGLSGYMRLPRPLDPRAQTKQIRSVRAVAMSGTGNGDSFLRVNAVRTAAAMARFSTSNCTDASSSNDVSLQHAVTSIAGPNGVLQQSAEDRWHKTGEGEGGIIGIELHNGKGKVVFDYNCGGMFHAWVDDAGNPRFALFQDDKCGTS